MNEACMMLRCNISSESPFLGRFPPYELRGRMTAPFFCRETIAGLSACSGRRLQADRARADWRRLLGAPDERHFHSASRHQDAEQVRTGCEAQLRQELRFCGVDRLNGFGHQVGAASVV